MGLQGGGSNARRATLRTIAEKAGVSVSTVSRVLNAVGNEASRAAGPATIARIRAIADELSYVPDPSARSLKLQKTRLLGVLVPRLSDVVLATIYEGIEEAAATYGYHTVVANTRDELNIQRSRTELMLDRRVDGLIFGHAHTQDEYLNALADREVPFVLVSRHAGIHTAVTCDDWEGGRLAADHLLQLGHRRVAVVAGEPYASTGVDRTGGFRERMAEAGVDVPAELVMHSHFDTGGGHEATRHLLGVSNPPTAIFAVNDFAAIGTMGAIREVGLQVGSDVSVVGFNDVPLARDLPLPLTTIRSPIHEMGQRGVHLLMQVLAGEEANSEILPVTLQVRDSSGPVRR